MVSKDAEMQNLVEQSAEELDYLMAGAIGALLVILFASFVILIYMCVRQKKGRNWERLDKRRKSKPEPELALALSEIGLGNALEQILNDEHWINDASGLIPQCLAVLRTCHSLTERITGLAMGPQKASTLKLVEAAKRIPSRVDDVVKSMYPPLDPRLLEARTAALVLAVGQLTLLAQNLSGFSKQQVSIEKGLDELDGHLAVLRKASNEIEASFMNNNAANSEV